MSSADPSYWSLLFIPAAVRVAGDPALQRAFSASRDEDVVSLPSPMAGRPFLVGSSGELHTAGNGFFGSAKMRNRALGTNRRYAHSLLVWINFLQVRGLSWDDAREDDVLDFKFWRRHDPANPRRISGSAWSSDLAALSEFYRWCSVRLNGPDLFDSARPNAAARSHFGGTRADSRSDLRPTAVRKANVKWLSPGAVARWRDIGIHGLTPEGSERVRWRPRSQTRDASFVDGMYASGLRLQEWSSVLLCELERKSASNYSTFHLADACAKGNRGHPYWLRQDALDSVGLYTESERAAAVRRGQKSGLYEADRFVSFIEERKGPAVVLASMRDPSQTTLVRINDIDPVERSQMLVRTRDGFEPAMLWLNEDGSPRQKAAWGKTFDRANARVRRAGIERLECHPHMLRHSFALRWFAVGRMIWSSQWSDKAPDHARDFREQFGDTWSLVQTMLGHADVSTTKDTYLEPFQNLEARLLLEYGRTALDTESLNGILSRDDRVRLLDAQERWI